MTFSGSICTTYVRQRLYREGGMERSNLVTPVEQRIPSVGFIMEKMDRDKDAAAGGDDSFCAYRVDAACRRLLCSCKGGSYTWETPNKMHLRRLDLYSPCASWKLESGSNMAASAFEWRVCQSCWKSNNNITSISGHGKVYRMICYF